MTNYLYHIESFLHTLENSFQGFSKVKSNLYTFENDILGNNGEIKSPSDSKKAKMTTRKKSNNDDVTNTSPLKRVNFAKTLNQRKFSDMYQFNKKTIRLFEPVYNNFFSISHKTSSLR